MSKEIVDVSLTTINSRIDLVSDTLHSLLDQSAPIASIRLYISREPYLLDEGIKKIPASLSSLATKSRGRLVISYCPNFGPYRKLLPYLREYWGQSRLVVTADDDTIYPKDWMAELLGAYATYRCQIASRGHRILTEGDRIAPYRNWMRTRVEENPSLLIMPTGKDGILYDTAYFPIEVLDVETAMTLAPTADDLWFRWHLARNNIPVCLVNTNYKDTFDESEYESSLYRNYNRGGNNDKAVEDIDNYFKTNVNFSLAASGEFKREAERGG